MATTKRRHSKEEFARRGDAIFEQDIRPQLKTEDDGKFAAIDGSEVVVGQSGIAHDAALSAGLQVLVGVDGHHRPPPRGGVAIDVVAAVDAGERPAALLEDAAHPLAGDDLHAAPPAASLARASSWATASHPSAASRRLARTSSRVSPWV